MQKQKKQTNKNWAVLSNQLEFNGPFTLAIGIFPAWSDKFKNSFTFSETIRYLTGDLLIPIFIYTAYENN